MAKFTGQTNRSLGGSVLIGVAAVIGSGAGADDLQPITVTCRAAASVNADWADRICTEFLAVLTATRKDRPVLRAQMLASDSDGLAVMVEAANERTVGLQLTWHPHGAAPIAARPLALSIMGRNTTDLLRANFFRRVLADAVMPF